MQRKYCPIAWGYIVDFAIGPVTQFVLDLPSGKVEFFFFFFFEEFKLQRNCVINPSIKTFLGPVEMMTFGQVHASYRSLPEWQVVKVVKLTLF